MILWKHRLPCDCIERKLPHLVCQYPNLLLQILSQVFPTSQSAAQGAMEASKIHAKTQSGNLSERSWEVVANITQNIYLHTSSHQKINLNIAQHSSTALNPGAVILRCEDPKKKASTKDWTHCSLQKMQISNNLWDKSAMMMSVKQWIIVTSMFPNEPTTNIYTVDSIYRYIFCRYLWSLTLEFIQVVLEYSTRALNSHSLPKVAVIPCHSLQTLRVIWCSKCLNAVHCSQSWCVAGRGMQHHRWSRGSFGHWNKFGSFPRNRPVHSLWRGRFLRNLPNLNLGWRGCFRSVTVRIVGWLSIAYHRFTWTISMLESFFSYPSIRSLISKAAKSPCSWLLTWYLVAISCLHSLWSALAKWLTWFDNVARATHRCFWESTMVRSNILGIQGAFCKRTVSWRHAMKNEISTNHNDSSTVVQEVTLYCMLHSCLTASWQLTLGLESSETCFIFFPKPFGQDFPHDHPRPFRWACCRFPNLAMSDVCTGRAKGTRRVGQCWSLAYMVISILSAY